MTKPIAAFDKWFIRLNEWVVVLLLAAMIANVFANVAMRSLIGVSMPWAEEFARACLVWFVMVGAGIVLRRGGHIGLDALQRIVPRATALAIRVAILVCIALFSLATIWAGYQFTSLGAFQKMPIMGFPYSCIYAAFPLGGALLLAHTALFANEYVRDGYREALPGSREYG